MAQERLDYGSILFNGNCNSKCPECIGKLPQFDGLEENLKKFPLKGLDEFIDQVNLLNIGYISISGVKTDPQLYQHEGELLAYVRNHCTNRIALSLHTNGLLAIEKGSDFQMYDKATISFPSFDLDTYEKITGVRKMPDIDEIIRRSNIPIKLSMLLTEHNKEEFDDYIKRSKEMGIKRIVVRKLFGKEDNFTVLEDQKPTKLVHNCPVYFFHGVEVTVWNFTKSTVQGIYLFPDGSIRTSFI